MQRISQVRLATSGQAGRLPLDAKVSEMLAKRYFLADPVFPRENYQGRFTA
jgi:hypothetical protein